MNEITARREYLYGPRRRNANTSIKDFLQKDHVFSKDGPTRIPWQTTSLACFGKKSVELDRETAQLSTEIQRTSNFQFGDDYDYPLMTTTCFQFCKNLLPPVKQIVHDVYSTNILDFPRSSMQDKTNHNNASVYGSDYHSVRTCSKAVSRRKNQLKQQTEDMRSTHFNLGSNKQRKCSETVHSYHSSRSLPCISSEPHSQLLSGASSVFRNGDWNMIEPCATTTSNRQDDLSGKEYLALSLSSSRDKICRNQRQLTMLNNPCSVQSKLGLDAFPQGSTTFKLGSYKCLGSSLYQKDFLEFGKSLQPLNAHHPKSSKVLLQLLPGMVYPRSTQESDFVYRQDEALDFLEGRMHEFERNQERHKVSCVVLTNDAHEEKEREKQVTISCKDYQEPSRDLLRCYKLHRRPTPMYNYILLDKDLGDEQHQMTRKCHKTPISGSLDEGKALGGNPTSKECDERLKDNHKTHFTLGSDSLSPPKSEQHDQFRKTAPLDPGYPAAGKAKLVLVRDAHIYARDDISSAESIAQPSVMKADYQPAVRLSSAQRRLVTARLKYPLAIAPSHYFHMDHDVGGRRLSTTTTDYIPPEIMTDLPGVVP